MEPEQWVVELLGPSATGLLGVIARGIQRAHGYAAAAQAAGGTPMNDPYGHTMKRRQYECLIEEAADFIAAGEVELFQPTGSPFVFLRVCATGALISPWRYATSLSTDRLRAVMRISDFRRDLYASNGDAAVWPQLTLEQGLLSEEELDAQFAERQALGEQLRRKAPVLTAGFCSNPAALATLGVAVVELIDEECGHVSWVRWQPLLAGSSLSAVPSEVDAPRLRAVPEPRPAALAEPVTRFDALATPDDDFGLRAVNPSANAEQPVEKPEANPGETGEERS